MSLSQLLRHRREQIVMQQIATSRAYGAIRSNLIAAERPAEGTLACALYDEHRAAVQRGELTPVLP